MDLLEDEIKIKIKIKLQNVKTVCNCVMYLTKEMQCMDRMLLSYVICDFFSIVLIFSAFLLVY
jgi:hypothetical protein